MRISYNGTLWTGPSNEVLLWTFDLDAIDSGAVSAVLSPAEHERAARFRFEVHRNRFIAGRGALRIALGAVLEKPPESLEFTYGSHGKPEHPEIFFNLSHSDKRALLGVTRAGAVGVDVEQVRAARAGADIAERFFAQREIEQLRLLTGEAYTQAFFEIWSRKEAVLKGVGTGISGGLSSFAVPLGPMPEHAYISSEDCWVGNLAAAFPYLQAEGFASAIALLGQAPLVRPVCDTVLRIPVRRTFK